MLSTSVTGYYYVTIVVKRRIIVIGEVIVGGVITLISLRDFIANKVDKLKLLSLLVLRLSTLAIGLLFSLNGNQVYISSMIIGD